MLSGGIKIDKTPYLMLVPGGVERGHWSYGKPTGFKERLSAKSAKGEEKVGAKRVIAALTDREIRDIRETFRPPTPKEIATAREAGMAAALFAYLKHTSQIGQ